MTHSYDSSFMKTKILVDYSSKRHTNLFYTRPNGEHWKKTEHNTTGERKFFSGFTFTYQQTTTRIYFTDLVPFGCSGEATYRTITKTTCTVASDLYAD